MNEKLKINLSIGGNVFPVNIDRKDEELVRAAAKQVEMRYNNFRSRYRDVTPIEAMTMTAYQSAVNEFKGKDCNDTEPYSSKIEELSELIEEYIHKSE